MIIWIHGETSLKTFLNNWTNSLLISSLGPFLAKEPHSLTWTSL